MIVTVKGKIFTGSGDGKKYISLHWVRRQAKEKLGFDPYPGTLNLTLPPDAEIIRLLKAFRGWETPSKKGYFPGRFYRALIMGEVFGAVVRPEVPSYPETVLEVIAPLYLREKFRLKDGDELEIKIWLE